MNKQRPSVTCIFVWVVAFEGVLLLLEAGALPCPAFIHLSTLHVYYNQLDSAVDSIELRLVSNHPVQLADLVEHRTTLHHDAGRY